ncbi:MAG TPA: hypothetical protein EYP19_12465 [Desulfobacterales bacterium]|jgi:cytochrome c-type biogenesis protein CcmF|nr:hypothetical protein [Desulfobacterales bacterium]
MNNPGQLTLWVEVIAVFVSSVSYLVLCFSKHRPLTQKVARLGFACFALCTTIASILLMSFILNHDFRYSYVAGYSSRDLPLQYLISSFWAGQEGSFLLWVLLGSWLGILLMFKAKDMEPQVMLIYNLNHIFLSILLIKQSPFELLVFPPPDGQGLNMLLQDPWMVVHPPVVFLGYAAFAVPFAFAVAALWRREYVRWVRPALPWAAFSFVTLGAGIFIGGYWSYKVLGWGGYWGWDPVENASLLPWLAGTALMHGMILQRTLGKLPKTNFLLATLSFLLIIYCTFLTRSGVLADFSVHSFVDLGITGWLVIFMVVFLAISLGLFVIRAKDIPVPRRGENFRFFSREFGFVAAMILLGLSTLFTGLGTSAPLITRVLEKASKVSTEFYVYMNLPLAILMLLLLSFVPLMVWGKNSLSRLSPKLIWAMAGAIVAVIITLLKGYPNMGTGMVSLGVLLLSLFAGAAGGMNLFLTAKFIRKKITLSSAPIAHLGVAVMFFGVVLSSAYDKSEKVLLEQGTVRSAMGYELEFHAPTFSREGKGVRLRLPLEVKTEGAEFTAQPDIYSERAPNGQVKRFMHPHIKQGLISDLYISPVDYLPGKKRHDSGNHIVLQKDNEVEFHDYRLKFAGFDVSGMRGRKGAREMTVGADIEVSYKGAEPVTLKPAMIVGKKENPSSRVKLPGPENAYLVLKTIDAGTKTIGLLYEGPAAADAKEPVEKPPALIVEVSTKPGMTTLWLGTVLILAGGVIAIVRRLPK